MALMAIIVLYNIGTPFTFSHSWSHWSLSWSRTRTMMALAFNIALGPIIRIFLRRVRNVSHIDLLTLLCAGKSMTFKPVMDFLLEQ